MRNYKKILAAGLAVSMVMGSSVVAFAAEGSGSGSGSLDVVEKSDVFDVVLPTDSGTTFDYILDPTGVIKATEAEKYGGATFADGATVFFANAATTEGGSVTYSATSDAIKAVNKSTMDVDITVKASVADVSGITMASSGTFDADDTSAGLYLALKDSDTNNSDTAVTADGVELTSTIAALADAYETKYVDGKYVKQLKTDATGFEEYSFQLTGACNPKGEWAGLTEEPPVVNVVWSIEDPTVTGPRVTLSPSGEVNIVNLEGSYTSFVLNDGTDDWTLGGADGTWTAWDDAADAEKTFQLGDNWMSGYLAGKTVIIKVGLPDGTTIESAAVVFPAA